MTGLAGHRRARGFTLMEVLAALVLMSLLMLGVWAGIRTAMHSMRFGLQFTARTDAVRSTQDFIRRELSQAIALPWKVNATQSPVAFTGSAREIQFVAPLPGYLGRLGPQLQTLKLVHEDDGDGYQLQVAFAQLSPDGSPPTALGKPQVLLSGIRRAHFSFRGKDRRFRDTGWQPEWDLGDRMPALVRLDAVLDHGDWPQLLVPVRIDRRAVRGAGAMIQRMIRPGSMP